MILPYKCLEKKKRKLKEPKNSRKVKKVSRLTLYFEIIQVINDAGLTQPSKVEDILKYLEELEKRAKVEKGDTFISEPEKE